VEIFHSNVEGEVINRFYDTFDRKFDGALINPAGYTTDHPALCAAITQVGFPVIEVHSPTRQRGVASPTWAGYAAAWSPASASTATRLRCAG